MDDITLEHKKRKKNAAIIDNINNYPNMIHSPYKYNKFCNKMEFVMALQDEDYYGDNVNFGFCEDRNSKSYKRMQKKKNEESLIEDGFKIEMLNKKANIKYLKMAEESEKWNKFRKKDEIMLQKKREKSMYRLQCPTETILKQYFPESEINPQQKSRDVSTKPICKTQKNPQLKNCVNNSNYTFEKGEQDTYSKPDKSRYGKTNQTQKFSGPTKFQRATIEYEKDIGSDNHNLKARSRAD